MKQPNEEPGSETVPSEEAEAELESKVVESHSPPARETRKQRKLRLKAEKLTKKSGKKPVDPRKE